MHQRHDRPPVPALVDKTASTTYFPDVRSRFADPLGSVFGRLPSQNRLSLTPTHVL